MSDLFKTRKSYSFEVYPSAILGNNFNNVTVTGIIDGETASRIIDVHSLHAQIYPAVSPGTPDDPLAYDYITFRAESGIVTALGIPWIREDTVISSESNTLQVMVSNVTINDVPKLRAALISNGFTSFNIKPVNTPQ